MARKSVMEMPAEKLIGLLVQKAEKKGRTRTEVEECIRWLTGYSPEQIQAQLERGVDYGTFFREAPEINQQSQLVTGVICGVRIEEIQDPQMRVVRVLDKLVDELAKGRPMSKILRSGPVA